MKKEYQSWMEEKQEKESNLSNQNLPFKEEDNSVPVTKTNVQIQQTTESTVTSTALLTIASTTTTTTKQATTSSTVKPLTTATTTTTSTIKPFNNVDIKIPVVDKKLKPFPQTVTTDCYLEAGEAVKIPL